MNHQQFNDPSMTQEEVEKLIQSTNLLVWGITGINIFLVILIIALI